MQKQNAEYKNDLKKFFSLNLNRLFVSIKFFSHINWKS